MLAAAVAFGITLAVGLSVQIMYERLPAYQQKRIATFLNPEADPLGAGYNVVQSKIAIGSGGFTGKGFLRGTQTQLNYIPEQWTDFIFCVPAEEFGFIGATFILLLYAVFSLRGLAIARKLEFRFSSLVVVGIVAMFAFHVFVSVRMTLGTMPVIGIPLPFMSYGGSGIVANCLALALLFRIDFENRCLMRGKRQ